VYSYLDLVEQKHTNLSKKLMQLYKSRFENAHADELANLSLISTPKQLEENSIAQLYRKNKYRIPLNKFIHGTLFNFLQRYHDECDGILEYILSTYCTVEQMQRGPIEPFSFEAIFHRGRNLELDDADIQEGVPGIVTTTGSYSLNKEIIGSEATMKFGPLKLGPLPIDQELRGDVLAELEEEDKMDPPRDGTRSLVDEFNSIHNIKKEDGESPQRTDIPYPPSRARDIVMEMQKVRENRDRFKIEGRTGGVGPGVSVAMYTMHNTLGT
jgi:transcription initiation factor TFIID subunit 5